MVDSPILPLGREKVKMKKKKVAFHTLGCKVNAYETEAMRRMLAKQGYETVAFEEEADVYVVNTCTVTNLADRKSRQMLHRARRRNPDAIVVAVGCYAQAAGEALKKDGTVDLVVGNNHKQDLPALLREYEGAREKAAAVSDIAREPTYEPLFAGGTREHTRAYLKVQDGCDQFCSYCAIPFVRGRARSRELADVLREVRVLSENGYKEVVLTGIHLSSYGRDRAGGEDLAGLVEAVHQVPGIARIRLGSLEPGIVTEAFAGRLAALPKVCPHFHLSLQSGCDATLRRMNRRYTTAEYEQSCARLRDAFAHPAITTDVIVGFPQETGEEFVQTAAFVEKIGFFETHIFPYSRREGTRAARMGGQVPESEKEARSRVLRKLNAAQKAKFEAYYEGRRVEALFEEKIVRDGKTFYVGHTREYLRVLAADAGRDLRNEICDCIFQSPDVN